MPLPDGGSDLKWPPEEWEHVYARYKEHSAWYSGSPNQLAAVHFAAGNRPQGFWRMNYDVFWASNPAPQRRLMLHEPIAAALATVSSDLLFAEQPDFVISPEEPGAEAVQARLDEIERAEAIKRTQSELAETVCALGGGFQRVIWNKEFEPDHPMLTAVDADAAIPEFQWGRLVAVTFWKVIQGDEKSKEIWRYLERHEPGAILSGLYLGNQAHLGRKMPLASMGDLAYVEEVVETGIEALTAVYVPNVRPNRLFRGTPLGRSDYDGVEAQMNALDEAATSLMRDLRLARARLIVPGELLEQQGKGKGAKFDLDQEVWEALPSMPPTADKMITPSQFLIRADDHLKVIKSRLSQIITSAGYSITSFGLEEPRAVPATATEIVNRERQSFLTRGEKIAYWTPPLEQILEVLLAIDAKHFQSHEVYRPRVDFADSIRDDETQTATVVHILRSAEAASAEVRVRMVHPKWTDQQVEEETKRILDEGAAKAPIPSIGSGAPLSPNGQPVDQPMDGQRVGNFAAPPAEGE